MTLLLFSDLITFLKECTTNNILNVIMVGRDGYGPDLLEYVQKMYYLNDLSNDEAKTFLKCVLSEIVLTDNKRKDSACITTFDSEWHRPLIVPEQVSENVISLVVSDVAGGRIADLTTCAKLLNLGHTPEEIKKIFDVRESIVFDKVGLYGEGKETTTLKDDERQKTLQFMSELLEKWRYVMSVPDALELLEDRDLLMKLIKAKVIARNWPQDIVTFNRQSTIRLAEKVVNEWKEKEKEEETEKENKKKKKRWFFF